MEPFIEQLSRLCREHPTRAKWVFVPAHGVGRTVGDRIALAGTDWANLRFVTPLDIALRMGAPFLVERGIDPSEEGLGPALIMRLLLDLPDDHVYFRPLAGQPQIAIALWSTMRELRMAGLGSSDLVNEGFASPAKFDEFRALLAAYESYLETHRRGDRLTVFREAMAHPDWCPIQTGDCWTVMPDVVWSSVERDLIASMPGERIVPEALDLPGATMPRRLAGADVRRIALATGRDRTPSLAWLMTPGGHPTGGGAGHLSLFRAGGPEAEVEEVFRRIVASGTTLDDVEITASSDGYATLIWEKACRYDWPVTLAGGLPVTLTRPGRALVGLAEWIEDDFAAGLLRRLFESGDLTLGETISLTPARAARLLVRAEAAWGRETYRRALGRLATSSRASTARDDVPDDERAARDHRADQADKLATWIDALIALVPRPGPDGLVNLQAYVACAHRFVSTFAARTSALDAAAATVLSGALDELRALGTFPCRPEQALRFLRERVEGLRVGVDRPRPGHLHVSTPSSAGLAHRRRLFVVGLEEGRVFPASFEDPILLDPERATLDVTLRQSTDRTDEAVYAMLARLAAASSNPDVGICLSYSCRDLRQFRETYASWVMLQAFRVLSGNRTALFRDLHAHLGAPKSCVPVGVDDALSEGRWWLQGVSRAGEEAGRSAVLARYPSLAAGIGAATARASDRFTAYDGHVPGAGPWLDPAADDRVVSPTQLESAAGCPFRFFLERGLGVRAIESGERDREVWLDPLVRGSLLHDLYARLLRRCRDDHRRVTLEADRAWLLAEGERALDELKREMPPPSHEVEMRERQALLGDLDLFVGTEAEADPSRTPVGLEVSFGKADLADGEPLASAEPAVVAVGDMTFRVAGRVDRIDRVDPSSPSRAGGSPAGRTADVEKRTGQRTPAFRIVDYKTGGYWPDDWQGTFGGGRMLQHALYGLAVADLLRRSKQAGKVVAAEYYFSAAKGRLARKEIAAPPLADVAAVLGDLREVIASGLFVHAPSDGGCKFCDLKHACGNDAWARAAEKLSDPLLEPYRRLRDRG